MKKTVETSGGGIGFCGMLAVLFIGLKLAHVIDWEWVWVLSPLWLPIALVFGIILVILIITALIAIFGVHK